jgi:hypothetical protein
MSSFQHGDGRDMGLRRPDAGRTAMMNGFGTGMGFGAGIGMLLALVLVVLAIAALIKYLRS